MSAIRPPARSGSRPIGRIVAGDQGLSRRQVLSGVGVVVAGLAAGVSPSEDELLYLTEKITKTTRTAVRDSPAAMASS